jgi:polyisoprenoid-binding protein YceI
MGGDLTFHGVTRPCEGEMELEVLDERTMRLTGESTFDVRDFGVDPPRLLVLKVEPEVVVRVELIAMR